MFLKGCVFPNKIHFSYILHILLYRTFILHGFILTHGSLEVFNSQTNRTDMKSGDALLDTVHRNLEGPKPKLHQLKPDEAE